jgi:hypothetical protein
MAGYLKLLLTCGVLAGAALGCTSSQSQSQPAPQEPERMTAYDVAAIVARQSNPAPVAMSSGDAAGRRLFSHDADTALATGAASVHTADVGRD